MITLLCTRRLLDKGRRSYHDNSGQSLLFLPLPIWSELFHYITINDIIALSEVCSALYWITKDHEIWETKITQFRLRNFPSYSDRNLPILPTCSKKLKDIYNLYSRSNQNWKAGKYRLRHYPRNDSSSIIALHVVGGKTPVINTFCTHFFEQYDLLHGHLVEKMVFKKRKITHACCTDTQAAISSQDGLRVLDLSKKTVKYELTNLFSHCNRSHMTDKYIAVGCWNGAVKVFSERDGSKVCDFLPGHSNPVYGMDLYGELLATASSDRTVKIWRISDEVNLQTLKGHSKTVLACHFLRMNQEGEAKSLLSGGKDGTLRLWDNESGKEISCFNGHKGAVNCISALGADRILSGGEDGTIKWWDMRCCDPVYQFLTDENHGAVNSMFVDPFRIVSGHENGGIIKHEFWS